MRYVYSTDLKVASKHYNVSPKQLERFINAEPSKLKGRLSRSPAYLRLYKTDAKEVASTHDVKLVPRLSSKRAHSLQKPGVSVSEKQRKAVGYYRASRVRVYQKSKTTGKVTYVKARESSERELREVGLEGYSSVNAVTAGYQSGQLSADDVHTIMQVWKAKYPKSRINFDDLEDSIVGEDIDVQEDLGL